ncbi:MAG: helix-turn-helix transcriptional regulator [Clostridia bacterium]|nr:helix-turn-helix transcriptional regulator [Clostridia bacterium]
MNNLKKLRAEKNISQAALCEELKKFNCFIERSAYSKFETGSREMGAGILTVFADYFGVTVDYILGR